MDYPILEGGQVVCENKSTIFFIRMITLYTAGDANSHKALGKKIGELKPGEYVVEVKRNRPIRSLSHNRYYFAILKVIASETGNDVDRLHEIAKKKFNGEMVLLPKSGAEMVGKSTGDLDSKEFSAYINRVKLWALDEFNVTIMERENVTIQNLMDIENNYERVFSGF